jgi:hypothetical protein
VKKIPVITIPGMVEGESGGRGEFNYYIFNIF